MTTATKLPEHKITEDESSRSIEIFGWRITATTKTIVSASEADALQKALGFPLPEMTFGTNSLQLVHEPTGWTYNFDLHNALSLVKNGPLGEGDGGVKVGYADAWLKSR